MVTGVTYYLQAWVIEKKGPVFLAMATPLALIMTIISSSFILGEIITLGRLYIHHQSPPSSQLLLPFYISLFLSHVFHTFTKIIVSHSNTCSK